MLSNWFSKAGWTAKVSRSGNSSSRRLCVNIGHLSDEAVKYVADDFLQVCSDVVDASECDKNQHLNVQYYVERFLRATELCVPDGSSNTEPNDLHFRFHRELLAGDPTTIRSGVVRQGASDSRLLHVLAKGDGDAVCATALGNPERVNYEVAITDLGIPDIAVPRNLPKTPYQPVDTAALVASELALTTKTGLVCSDECDEAGGFRADYMVREFHDAAMLLWQFVGFDPGWFSKGGLGGVAAEMKLTQFRQIGAGSNYEVVSWVPQMSKNVLHLANQLNDAATGDPVARICAASMIFDRKTRRPVEFPQSVQDGYAGRLRAFTEIDA